MAVPVLAVPLRTEEQTRRGVLQYAPTDRVAVSRSETACIKSLGRRPGDRWSPGRRRLVL